MATTLLNLPPSTPSNTDTGSDPGTPASGISTLSTTAIKDGHEGQHLHTSMDIAADRVARLGGIGTTPTKDYFEPPNIPHTPGSASIVSSLADEHGSIEGEAIGPNSTQAKRESMAAVLARRQLEQQQQQHVLNQSVPTISTAPAVSYGGFGGGSSSAGSMNSSTHTTPSAAEARVDAKLIDGMTYDEGDTTGEGLGRRDTLRPGQFPSGLGNLNGRDEDTSMD
ncbi:hypothetical protein TWF694_000869 [Orbilia ellipsospora]|uniref:Uncharacterized protein n=1 Tax=Orbilia ellipsospora TaxID=2528407 RepID=A0AAV9XTA4_9PEZI